MAQFSCKCGTKISLVTYPNEQEGQLIWSSEVEIWESEWTKEVNYFISNLIKNNKTKYIRDFYGTDDLDSLKDETIIADILSKKNKFNLKVIRCAKCERIFIEEKHGSNNYKSYKLETEHEATS